MKLASWLAIALFAGGHLFSIVHAATTQHSVCAEHGEVVDLGPGLGSDLGYGLPLALAASAFGPADHDLEGVRLQASDSESKRHGDHCRFCPALRQPAGQITAELATFTEAAEFEPTGAPVAIAPRQARLFRLAPKTSPPA